MDSDNNNVTHRKQYTGSLTNLSTLTNDDEKTILDTTMMSIPDSLHDNYSDNEMFNDLNLQVKTLKMQLMSAHQEIEDLNSENFRLKTDLQKSLKNVETCKKICLAPERKCSTPSSSRKKKSSHYITAPLALNNDSKTSNKEIKVDMLCKETQTSDMTYYDIPKQKQKMTSNSQLSDIVVKKPSGVTKAEHKNRLSIISSSCSKGKLSLVEEVFSGQFNYCHYLLPNVITGNFLAGIENKLKDFSMQDYCLIFIGENDLRDNKYVDIIDNLKNSLQNVTHTNVVVCAPTYIKGALIHNYKVEMFNNLLCMDIKNYKYAYFFDSNQTLSYDMFSNSTGKLNKSGWRNIFEQIMFNIHIDYKLFGSQGDSKNRHIEIEDGLPVTHNPELLTNQFFNNTANDQFFLLQPHKHYASKHRRASE